MDKGINIEYTLTKEEALSSIYSTKRLKPHKRRSIIQSVVAIIAFVMFLTQVLSNPNDIFAYIMIGLSVMLIFSCWFFPKKLEKVYLEHNDFLAPRIFKADNNNLSMTRGEALVKFKVKNIENVQTIDNILLIINKKGQVIELPLRAATDEDIIKLDDILAKK